MSYRMEYLTYQIQSAYCFQELDKQVQVLHRRVPSLYIQVLQLLQVQHIAVGSMLVEHDTQVLQVLQEHNHHEVYIRHLVHR